MSNALTTIQTKDLLSQSDIDVLRQSKFRDFNDAEVRYACAVSKHLQLNPLLNQIHFVKRAGAVVAQVGIDGFRLAALRTGGYAGNDDAIFEGPEKQPTKATVTVHKIVSGVKCAFTGTARWDEYYPGDKLGTMWRKMPHTMLAKCAEALALRKAFPQELAGLRTDEEMAQADVKDLPSKASALNARSNDIEEAEIVEEKLGDFVCTIGKKFKGMKLSDIPKNDLENFVMWIEEQENPTKDFLAFAAKGKEFLSL